MISESWDKMDVISRLRQNRKVKAITLFLIISVINYLRTPMVKKIGLNVLLEADILNIYQKNELVATVSRPGYMIDTFKGSVGIYRAKPRQLGISRFRIKELYRLEFIKDGKKLMELKVLTPRSQKAIDKIFQKGQEDMWKELNGHLVIINEVDEYFGFGKNFYKELSRILEESGKH